jgi:hypothetical protein
MTAVTIGVVCEDQGHARLVTTLVDRALLAEHTWLDGVLEHCRTYVGKDAGNTWYKFHPADAHDLAPLTLEGRRIPVHGHIGGKPLKPEASMWRKILLMLTHANPRPNVVVLARDIDGYPERRGGVDQVRSGLKWPFPVAFAGPEPEVEAWYVAGFVPNGKAEHEELEKVRKELSFDPTTESHRLTSHPNEAQTDAKRVLERLSAGDPDREVECLSNRAILRDRGAKNGLGAFLDEVDEMIVPAFTSPI